MRRVVNFFKEWYDVPGGLVFGAPFLLAILLTIVGVVGDISLKLIF